MLVLDAGSLINAIPGNTGLWRCHDRSTKVRITATTEVALQPWPQSASAPPVRRIPYPAPRNLVTRPEYLVQDSLRTRGLVQLRGDILDGGASWAAATPVFDSPRFPAMPAALPPSHQRGASRHRNE